MAKTKPQTRTHNPKPIPAMLEGAFSTSIENRVAELNNQLAREGRLTNDPLAISLRGLRHDLKEKGFSFDRVGVVATPAAPAQPRTATTTPRQKTAPTQEGRPGVKARKISEERITELQVPGTVSETAPYGMDAEGRALAPYGVKRDGVPMKRRGRRKETTPAAAATSPATQQPTTTAYEEEESEDEEEVAAAVAALTSEEEDVETEVTHEESSDISEEDLDGLLENLDL